MPRNALIAALLLGATTMAHAAEPAAAPAAAAKHYTTAETPIGQLLDDPAAKAVLVKYVPQLAANQQIEMARGLTLKQVQAYAADMLTDEALGKIDYDLAKLPAKP